VAVRLLSVAAVVVAAATGFVLAVAAFDLIAQVPVVAAMGHWSPALAQAGNPIPDEIGAPAAITVAILAGAASVRAVRAGRDLAAAVATCRRLGPAAGRLVVVQHDIPDAYALPGLSGRIVVSTAMLAALPADERRVLLAHEDAHLAHHHHLYVQAAELAAAANPLLRPVAHAVRAGVERWADEVAATTVGDRQLTARAMARAGLARAHAPRPGHGATALALPGADAAIADRARALLRPPPARRLLPAAILTGLIIFSTAAATQTAHDTEHRFERAKAHATHPATVALPRGDTP
jgi:hypothetical protein